MMTKIIKDMLKRDYTRFTLYEIEVIMKEITKLSKDTVDAELLQLCINAHSALSLPGVIDKMTVKVNHDFNFNSNVDNEPHVEKDLLTRISKRILKTGVVKLPTEEIEFIMNNELAKQPGEIDIELVDICSDILSNGSKAIKRENLTFGEVIDLITNNEKCTIKAARSGWFDDIAFIILIEEGRPITQNDGVEVMLDPYITAVTPDLHYRMGWVPTQEDMFAKDWYIMND